MFDMSKNQTKPNQTSLLLSRYVEIITLLFKLLNYAQVLIKTLSFKI